MFVSSGSSGWVSSRPPEADSFGVSLRDEDPSLFLPARRKLIVHDRGLTSLSGVHKLRGLTGIGLQGQNSTLRAAPMTRVPVQRASTFFCEHGPMRWEISFRRIRGQEGKTLSPDHVQFTCGEVWIVGIESQRQWVQKGRKCFDGHTSLHCYLLSRS